MRVRDGCASESAARHQPLNALDISRRDKHTLVAIFGRTAVGTRTSDKPEGSAKDAGRSKHMVLFGNVCDAAVPVLPRQLAIPRTSKSHVNPLSYLGFRRGLTSVRRLSAQ